MAELHQCSDYDSGVVQYVHYEVRCMICWCLPPVRPGGGLTYLNITHLTSFRYQTVCNEILPMTAKLLFQSFVPLSLSLSLSFISFLCHYWTSCHRFCFPSFLLIRFVLTLTRRMVRAKLEILV